MALPERRHPTVRPTRSTWRPGRCTCRRPTSRCPARSRWSSGGGSSRATGRGVGLVSRGRVRPISGWRSTRKASCSSTRTVSFSPTRTPRRACRRCRVRARVGRWSPRSTATTRSTTPNPAALGTSPHHPAGATARPCWSRSTTATATGSLSNTPPTAPRSASSTAAATT